MLHYRPFLGLYRIVRICTWSMIVCFAYNITIMPDYAIINSKCVPRVRVCFNSHRNTKWINAPNGIQTTVRSRASAASVACTYARRWIFHCLLICWRSDSSREQRRVPGIRVVRISCVCLWGRIACLPLSNAILYLVKTHAIPLTICITAYLALGVCTIILFDTIVAGEACNAPPYFRIYDMI